MRVIVIGGSGHIGTYLVPRLVAAGNEVISVSRGQREPYQPNAAWKSVQTVVADREEEEARETFGLRLRDLRPDAVIDLICYTPDSARHLVEALRGQIQTLLMCSTLWVHGYSTEVPTTEEQPRAPFGYFGEYARRKAEIETYLIDEARGNGFLATVLHIGHLVGLGWVPLNPLANGDPEVFSRLAQGKEVLMPHLGMETLHHVHADDVAQGFMQALANQSSALGESFHIVSPAAVTLRGYAEAVASWFGRTANLHFVPWETWRAATPSEEDAACTLDHLLHSPCYSIAKAQRLLGYQPRYQSLPAIEEAMRWLVAQGIVTV